MVPRKTPLNRPTPTLPPTALQVSLCAPSLGESKRFAIAEPVTLIGSRRDGDFTLTHPDISKIHCAVVHTGRTLFVCDLRSRMGTYVNDHFANLAELQPGVALRLGAVPIEIEFGSNEEASAAAWSTAFSPTPLVLVGERSHTIEHAAAVIGRRSACDVVIDAQDVSLAHALLLFLDGRPAIFDLGSRSGTFVNGQSVEFEWLAPGDRLRVGRTEWRVDWAGPIGFDPATVIPLEAAAAAVATPTVPLAIEPPLAIIESLAVGTPVAASPAPPRVAIEPVPAAPAVVDEQSVLAAFRALTCTNEDDWTAIDASVKGLARTLDGARRVVTDQARRLQAWADELAQRASRLEAREAALAKRELKERATRSEIERFKKALSQAQGLFGLGEGRAPDAAAEIEEASAASASPQPPLVDRPLFGQPSAANGSAGGVPVRSKSLSPSSVTRTHAPPM